LNIRLTLGVILALFMIWSCGSSKGRLFEQLGELQRDVHNVERKASGDVSAEALVKTCKEKLHHAEELLVEGSTAEAEVLLKEVRVLLSEPVEPESETHTGPISISGSATWVRVGADDYQKLTEGVAPGAIERVQTGIRSRVVLNHRAVTVILPGQSEVVFEGGLSNKQARLELVKGNLSLEKKGGSSATLKVGNLVVELSNGQLDAANHKLTNNLWLSLFSGSLSWIEDGNEGELSGGEALILRDGVWEKTQLPLAPQISIPVDNQKIKGGPEQARIEFRWLGDPQLIYQIQVSDSPQFSKLEFDRIDVKGGHVLVTLDKGNYFWRVRGFAHGVAPGPFSRVASFTVEKGEKGDAPLIEAPTGVKGPYIRKLELEVISDTVIVTGYTKPGSRISVNGTKAMVEDDGSFRAIIGFTRSGLHKVITKSVAQDTGAETVVEKNVKISIR